MLFKYIKKKRVSKKRNASIANNKGIDSYVFISIPEKFIAKTIEHPPNRGMHDVFFVLLNC